MKNTLRDLGLSFGVFPTTQNNHLGDVAGVAIGHKTIRQENKINTGVTVVRPVAGDVFTKKPTAGFFCANGFGKFAGSTQVQELGCLESWIGLTNTLAVGTMLQELTRYQIEAQQDPSLISINTIIGETNDGFLNDITSLPITAIDVRSAIADVREQNTQQGSIGAGTGSRAFGLKGGIGSAGRDIPETFFSTGNSYRIGVMLVANFGGFLTLQGLPIWKTLGGNRFEAELNALKESGGSCVILVATDAPLDARQLQRLAARATFALGRTGGIFANQSGDYALAWSTNKKGEVRDDDLDPLFTAVMEAVEEAVFNAITSATTTEGFRGTLRAVSAEELVAQFEDYSFFKIPTMCGRNRLNGREENSFETP